MKKVLVFLLILSIAGGAVFALDLGNGLTVAGEVKAGLAVESEDDGKTDTDDTTARAWNQDAKEVFRIRTTFEYTADWGGAKIRFQSVGGDFSAAKAYGWGNFLDKKVVVYGGKGLDDLWGLGKLSANVFDPSVDGVDGIRLAFNLVDGLSLGYALPVTAAKQPIADVFGSSVFGGLYKSDLVTVALGVALNPGTDKKKAGDDSWKVVPDATTGWKFETVSGSGPVPAYDPWVRLLFGVEVNPIPGLSALVDLDLDTRKYMDTAKIGYVRIGPRVSYSTGPLTAHLKGDITIQNETLKDATKDQSTSTATEKPPVPNSESYARDGGPVKELGDPSALVELGGKYAITDTVSAYLNLGSDNVLWLAGEKNKPVGAGFYAKPGLTIKLGPSSSIEIFDKINKIGATEIPAVTGGPKARSPITNQFQIELVWSF
jgi:hypothetical protein